MSALSRALTLLKPKGDAVAQGRAVTPTWYPNVPGSWRPLPSYRDHLLDIDLQRRVFDSRTLMEIMFSSDPDVSAAVNAYLTVADTQPIVTIKKLNGQYAEDAYQPYQQLVSTLTHQLDLTQGYQSKTSLRRTAEELRYMCLLRGACAIELVADTNFIPTELRMVDAGTLRWKELTPGQYKPQQLSHTLGIPIDLDIPTFFYSNYRTSPLSIYPTSPFVAAINTIASRQQIINDLYRIMAIQGYPRLEITVLETVVKNAAPANIQADPTKLRAWVNDRMGDIRNSFAGIRPDEAMIHTDASTVKVLNERSAGMTLDITPVIGVLNAQNTAALKSMSTILGRGESGVNTASTEARIFSMNADELNEPVAEILSRALTCSMQLLGFPVLVDITFRSSELRPDTELEPMLIQKQTRLLQDLSLGLITDPEYHMWMFGRLPPKGAPKLSGTGFQQQSGVNDMDGVDGPNNQPSPLDRSVTPKGAANAKSNSVKPKIKP
jgi:hypothetical protein